MRCLNYFPDEFSRQVTKADNLNQLTALKELALCCTAYLLELSPDINIHNQSLISLRGGDNAWELRLYINTAIEKLEGLEFKVITCADTGATKLAPVEQVHQLGLSNSADAMELLLDIARQINAQEPLTDKQCPAQLRKGNQQDLDLFKEYCAKLNEHLQFFRYSLRNIFAFSEGVIPGDLAKLLDQYLPALRVMIIQADDGIPFLIAGHKIQVVLINLLKMVAERETELFGARENDEESKMSETNIEIMGNVETVVTGDHAHVEIGPKLNELIPLLQEMKK